MAAELKAVLDSWVRYEQQQKEEEQAQLARTVIDKVLKSLSEEKTQRDILAGAILEVERTYHYSKNAISCSCLLSAVQNWLRARLFRCCIL